MFQVVGCFASSHALATYFDTPTVGNTGDLLGRFHDTVPTPSFPNPDFHGDPNERQESAICCKCVFFLEGRGTLLSGFRQTFQAALWQSGPPVAPGPVRPARPRRWLA